MKRAVVAMLIVLPLLLAATRASAANVEGQAPDFTLKSLDGSNLRLNEYRGQVVLINFWASWCGPCRQEFPLLDRMHQRYRDAGFAVLGVNVEEDPRQAREFLEKVRVEFPILFDEQQSVSETYRVMAMPSSVVLDRDGIVRYVHLGYKPGDEVKYLEVIQKLIRE
jgi:peroxiredoxin